jgi:hypothetical protein
VHILSGPSWRAKKSWQCISPNSVVSRHILNYMYTNTGLHVLFSVRYFTPTLCYICRHYFKLYNPSIKDAASVLPTVSD